MERSDDSPVFSSEETPAELSPVSSPDLSPELSPVSSPELSPVYANGQLLPPAIHLMTDDFLWSPTLNRLSELLEQLPQVVLPDGESLQSVGRERDPQPLLLHSVQRVTRAHARLLVWNSVAKEYVAELDKPDLKIPINCPGWFKRVESTKTHQGKNVSSLSIEELLHQPPDTLFVSPSSLSCFSNDTDSPDGATVEQFEIGAGDVITPRGASVELVQEQYVPLWSKVIFCGACRVKRVKENRYLRCKSDARKTLLIPLTEARFFRVGNIKEAKEYDSVYRLADLIRYREMTTPLRVTPIYFDGKQTQKNIQEIFSDSKTILELLDLRRERVIVACRFTEEKNFVELPLSSELYFRKPVTVMSPSVGKLITEAKVYCNENVDQYLRDIRLLAPEKVYQNSDSSKASKTLESDCNQLSATYGECESFYETIPCMEIAKEGSCAIEVTHQDSPMIVACFKNDEDVIAPMTDDEDYLIPLDLRARYAERESQLRKAGIDNRGQESGTMESNPNEKILTESEKVDSKRKFEEAMRSFKTLISNTRQGNYQIGLNGLGGYSRNLAASTGNLQEISSKKNEDVNNDYQYISSIELTNSTKTHYPWTNPLATDKALKAAFTSELAQRLQSRFSRQSKKNLQFFSQRSLDAESPEVIITSFKATSSGKDCGILNDKQIGGSHLRVKSQWVPLHTGVENFAMQRSASAFCLT